MCGSILANSNLNFLQKANSDSKTCSRKAWCLKIKANYNSLLQKNAVLLVIDFILYTKYLIYVQKIIIVADCGVSGGREHREQVGQLQKSHLGGWRLFHQRVCLGLFPLAAKKSQSQPTIPPGSLTIFNWLYAGQSN